MLSPASLSSATRPQQIRRILAALAVPVFLFGWGFWATLAPHGGSGTSSAEVGLDLEEQARMLSPERIAESDEGSCGEIAGQYVALAAHSGIDPRESLAKALPDAHRVIGMLSRDRDLSDFENYADNGGALGHYYGEEAKITRQMRPLRSRYEAVYASAYEALGGVPTAQREAPTASSGAGASEATGPTADFLGGGGRRKPYVASPDDVWLPSKSDLRRTHQYALDIFFFHVDRSGEEERGPQIRALYPGLVVCSAADWSGGAGEDKWRSGGLSPAAGDGVVVYSPSVRRYVSYFHLSSLACRTGDLIKAGDVLGRGGNTGVHARMKGHGEHVHVEIFDCARDSGLSIYEIYDLVRR